MTYKVSIIVPVYNVEEFLRQCLDSVLYQSIDEMSDIEVIMINDGSTDNSLKILQEYEFKYKNFKLINQENQGLSKSRNNGISAASGEYLYFLDSDDYIDVDTIKICYETAKENKLDILTFDANEFIDSEENNNLNTYNRDKFIKSKIMNGEDFYSYIKKHKSYRAPVWIYFYRKDFIDRNKLLFYNGILHEDELFTIKSILNASRIMYIPNKFYNRRIRSNSITTTKIKDINAESMLIIAEEVYKFYESNKNKWKQKTNNTIFKHLKELYSKAIEDCDRAEFDHKNDKFIMRKSIEDSLFQKNIPLNASLIMQIKYPSIFYKYNQVKQSIKVKIKEYIFKFNS